MLPLASPAAPSPSPERLVLYDLHFTEAERVSLHLTTGLVMPCTPELSRALWDAEQAGALGWLWARLHDADATVDVDTLPIGGQVHAAALYPDGRDAAPFGAPPPGA